MKCLVTGGAGFVGSNLIKRLLEGYDNRITSLDNYTTGDIENQQKGCKYIHGDIRDYKALGKFDVIFHMAALPRIGPSFKNPKEVFEINVSGTQNILEYARVYNIPVIYAGSSSFHGGVYKNPYTFTKWQGEELCKMYGNIFGVSSSICRFYNVYGDHMINEGAYRTVLSIFKEQYEKGEPLTITGDGEQRRDFTHVDDVVDGMIRVMKAMFGEVDMFYHGAEFELGRGKNYSINEVVDMFGSERVYIDPIKGEVKETLCKDKKTKEILEWKPKNNLGDWINELKTENT
tara:strand:- start:1858 stop:2724 length:867 start_codon:yes stop_codon:yes gene_type:complete